jgi:hypothetical protein
MTSQAAYLMLSSQVTNRMFLVVWFIGVPTSMGAIAVFALNHEFLAVRREIKNGSYSPWAYLISNFLFQARYLTSALEMRLHTVQKGRDYMECLDNKGLFLNVGFFLQIPMMFILAVCILSVAAYGIANFQQAEFGMVRPGFIFSTASSVPEPFCVIDARHLCCNIVELRDDSSGLLSFNNCLLQT